MNKPLRAKRNFGTQRKIATVLLVVFVTELLRPAAALALTSGPAQPEVQSFQPAGVSDMVDLQSGDFKYNIPLLDIDGYPLDLGYHSGSGMDDEASWVGLGWTLNPGSINRQVRGVPDDMKGDDATVQHHTKPMVTIGGRVTAKTEIFGFGVVSGSGSVSYGAYINNYTGIGAEIAANAGISLSRTDGGMMTGGLGFGISSDSQKGVDVSPYASLSIADNASNSLISQAGLSASLGYNTRSGMKSLSLGSSFGNTLISSSSIGLGGLGTGISYNTEPLNPKIITPYTTTSTSYSLDAGLSAGIFVGGGFTGYRTEKKVKNEVMTNPAYGLLYAEKGKNTPNAVMDFVREKENPVIPELSNLPVPIPTPDMFSFSSQIGSGQFRLYRGGSGIFFDAQAKDESNNTSFGGDFGGSALGVHAGVTYFNQKNSTTTGKWTQDNNYLSYGDFQDQETGNPFAQHAYFKVSGELNKQDKYLADQLGNTAILEPQLAGRTATQNFYGNSISQKITKQTRETGKTAVAYLTASEAALAGLDKTINTYPFYTDGAVPQLPAKPVANTQSRVDATRKGHHLSEMTVTESSGKRLVYGMPVYNSRQDEYSFAVGSAGTYQNVSGKAGLMDPQFDPNTEPGANDNTIPGAGKGIDNYYHRESKAPYATSYLLSAVLSPDYVDKTGDGISDDDLGTAIKFNYSKLSNTYKWRTPYQYAALNQGLLADPDDDKASIVYGEKEVCYISSIESKTKIAYFITKDRDDALGVKNWWTGGQDAATKQKCLTEIRLYSKADMTRPIKTVKFKYNYTICPGVPNNINGGGKLTLERVWFEYANVDKGKYNPYIFTYNTGAGYGYQQTDRWGTYKLSTANLDPSLSNEEFPYAIQQNRQTADQNAAMWQLSKIDLPTGGEIEVNYEADDYNYVQNRRAMAMYKIAGLVGISNPDRALIEANGIKLAIPSAFMPTAAIAGSATDRLKWFKNNFLSGTDYLYAKLNVNIGGSWDFISCYVEVTGVEFDLVNNTAIVRFDNITDGGITVNPLIIAAWQKLKNEYPRYAYPGYGNRTKADATGSIAGLVSATIKAAGNISELLKPFYKRAFANGLAGKVNLNKSFIRLSKYEGPKIGGGCRVKKIYINDEWSGMSGRSDHVFDAYYGQQYDYVNEDGTSSGVAAWEPAVGNDENPFKQPVFYTAKIKGAINDYMNLEEPFGESVFPAPAVTYARVKISNLNKDKTLDDTYRTGYLVNQFYTSKDFPVIATYTKITPDHYQPHNEFSFIKTVSDDELYMSQGYLVQLNDMDGKPKANQVFNQSGVLVSAVEYIYKTAKDADGQPRLDNQVKVVNKDGSVTNEVLGQDIEMFTDYREQESINRGNTVNIGSDIITAFVIPAIIPHFPIGQNDDYRLFRSACALKVVQSYGILDKVIKTENSSTITTQNIAFDGVTGEALVSKTQNEFNGDIYNVNLPAYWAYRGMGPAAKNIGLILSGLTTNASGFLTSYDYALDNGDELIDISSSGQGARYWVSSVRLKADNTPVHDGEDYWVAGSHDQKLLINESGIPMVSFLPSLVKVVRAGARNQLDDGISKIACLGNPISADNKFKPVFNQDLTSLKVINASASTFDENWSVEQPEALTKYTAVSPKIGFAFDALNSILDDAGYTGHGSDDFDLPPDNMTYIPTLKSPTNDKDYYNPDFIVDDAIRPKFHYSFIDNPNSVLISNSASHSVLSVYDTFTLPDTMISNLPLRNWNMIISGNIGAEFFFDDQICAHPPTVKVPTVPFPRNDFGLITSSVHLLPGKHTMRVDIHDYDVYNAASQGTPVRFLSMAIFDVQFGTSGPGGQIFTPKKYYSIRHLVNTPNQMVYQDSEGHKEARYTGVGIDPFGCDVPVTNPYTAGFKGNWRPYQTKVFQQSRVYPGGTGAQSKSVGVKNAGYINGFYTNWYYDPVHDAWAQPPNTGRWTVANSVTQYDKYGQQLENVDALQRASAAKFDFNGELPGAVASNARSRDIYSQTFEDAKFQPGTVIFNPNAYYYTYGTASVTSIPPTITDFISGTKSAASLATNKVSHSGNYSLQVPQDGITLTTILNSTNVKDDRYLDVDAKYRLVKSPVAGRYPKGFEPMPGKKYLFTAWVKDNQIPLNKTIYAYVGINNQLINLTCKAIVEQWKLIEGTFDVPAGATGTGLTIKIQSALPSMFIDDIRIHPVDSQMKTYAYDDQTMRLMAELDENAFATFYEYDSQGQLVRVKKETERGIVTLKESRSSYKKTL